MAKYQRPTSRHILPTLALFLALLTLSVEIGRAQDSRGDHSGSLPKIANRYDHKDFQATTNSVCIGANVYGLDCSSAAGIQAQDQLERIRREIERVEKTYPPPPMNNER